MKIIGISAFYHDSAAALISDENGSIKIIAAAQEERFTRKKFDESFPVESIKYCLRQANLSISDIDYIVFYDKPWITFERLLETYLSQAPNGLFSFLASMPQWLSWKLNLKKTMTKELIQKLGASKKISEKIYFSSHHLSHAASAFFASPFQEAAVLCMDGVGEWETTTLWHGKDNKIEPLLKIDFPSSLGLLYSAFTYFCGFKINSGEYKLMGLAPFGRPIYREVILKNLIDLKVDGSFKLNMNYFDYQSGFKMTSDAFSKLFNVESRNPDDPVRPVDMDLAASVQAVTEIVVERLIVTLKNMTGAKNLTLAGGVALNCVANGKIQKKNIFENIWVQPAAGDAGGSLGAALALFYMHLKNKRVPEADDLMNGSLLGTSYSDQEIEDCIKRRGLTYHKYDDVVSSLCRAAELVSKEKVVGLFQGRMEFGPRALGARSIIGDARVIDMQKRMNLKIKFRESFRPFAPAVLFERQKEIFDIDKTSPYMLMTAQIKERHLLNAEEKHQGLAKINEVRSKFAAITHVDNSARVQSVESTRHPLFYALIKEFDRITGSPVIINTSFNVRGEPIVESPDQAIDCFVNTDIDALCIGSFLIEKSDQKKHIVPQKDWREQFERD